MIPDFRHAIERVRAMTPRRRIIDRCNLTILLEPGAGRPRGISRRERGRDRRVDAVLLAGERECAARRRRVRREHRRAATAQSARLRPRARSCRCTSSTTRTARTCPARRRSSRPTTNASSREHFGIVFNHLYTITNLPVSRFASWLRHEGKYEEYLEPADRAVQSRDRRGTDVPQHDQRELAGRSVRLRLQPDAQAAARRRTARAFVWDLDPDALAGRPIATADHCFGCTAGAGSSCGGALT